MAAKAALPRDSIPAERVTFRLKASRALMPIKFITLPYMA
jgi:hypothetical protein